MNIYTYIYIYIYILYVYIDIIMYNMQSTWLFLLHQNQHLHSSRAWSPRLRRIPRGPRKSLCLLDVATWNLDGHWSWHVMADVFLHGELSMIEFDGIWWNWVDWVERVERVEWGSRIGLWGQFFHGIQWVIQWVPGILWDSTWMDHWGLEFWLVKQPSWRILWHQAAAADSVDSLPRCWCRRRSGSYSCGTRNRRVKRHLSWALRALLISADLLAFDRSSWSHDSVSFLLFSIIWACIYMQYCPVQWYSRGEYDCDHQASKSRDIQVRRSPVPSNQFKVSHCDGKHLWFQRYSSLNQAARQEAPIHWAPPQNMPVRKKGLQLVCWGVLCNFVPFLWGLLVVKHLSRLETDSLHLPCATFIITRIHLDSLVVCKPDRQDFLSSFHRFLQCFRKCKSGWMEICYRFILPLGLTCGCLKGNHMFPIGFHAWLLGCLQFSKMGPVWRTPRMVTLPSDLARGARLWMELSSNGSPKPWVSILKWS